MHLSDGLIVAAAKDRQREIRREFDRYHLARAVRAAQPPSPGQPSAPRRLAALLQRARRWTIGAVTMPQQSRAHADCEEHA